MQSWFGRWLAFSFKIGFANCGQFFFWRQRASDGLYSQSGVLLRTGQDTRARYIGAEQNLDLDWRVDRHTTVQVIAAYLRQTPPAGRNATDFSAKVNYKF